MMPDSDHARWMDAFLRSYCRHRPVNATFIGVHDHDHQLPDYSEQGRAAALADAADLLARERALPGEAGGRAAAIDRRLAAGFLRIAQWELVSPQYATGNPCAYTGEAIFGVLSLLRRPFAPLPDRMAAATARMEAIPALLEQAAASLRAAPPAWVERGLQECDAALLLFGDGLDQLIAASASMLGGHAGRARHAADRAMAALGSFRHFLESELRHRPGAAHSCGPEAFALLLAQAHCLAEGAEAIEAHAQGALETARGAIEAQAAALGARSWQDALAQLPDLHPPQARYYQRYQELWDACRTTAERHELLTWPDSPIRYVPQPEWVRAAAPSLYFLYYHAPASYDHLRELEYLVTPIEPDMPADEQLRRLRATNDSVIKLNHVVHHGAIGHHVQNWHAARAASQIGQIAAVDCASRIAMLCGGTMAEGWACYATDLMAEVGFLTPLELLAEQHTRMRMAARALVDVRMHHGGLSITDAASLYEREVGMPRAAAHAEATRNSMAPGSALMYLVGTDAIHQLRRALAARPGFTLRGFHDQFLSYGSIPVALIAEAMTAEWLVPRDRVTG
jgi:Bacterial protein of unknown function (DUF885)